QVGITVAQRREEELPQSRFRSVLDVVNHRDQAGIVRILIGTDAEEIDAKRLNFGAKHLRHGKDRTVTAAFEFDGKRDQRVHIAEGAVGGEDDSHIALRSYFRRPGSAARVPTPAALFRWTAAVPHRVLKPE